MVLPQLLRFLGELLPHKQALSTLLYHSSALSNVLPISNLPFASKSLEKLVFMKLNHFLSENCIFDKPNLVILPTTAQRQL
jgi:hypothetical protein